MARLRPAAAALLLALGPVVAFFSTGYFSGFGAVTAVDVSVQQLGIIDGDGAPVTGGLLIIAYEGVTIDKVGARLRLPDDAKREVLQAIVG